MVNRYRSRVSGPLLDRVDLHVFVRPLPADELMGPLVAESSSSVRQRVLAARQVQRKRFRRSRSRVNADMTSRQITHYCPLEPAGRRLLRQAIGRMGLSARAYHRIIKVARTIADLGEQEALTETHLQEAIQYRIFESQSVGPR
jgi:magnesium chelatase family protein